MEDIKRNKMMSFHIIWKEEFQHIKKVDATTVDCQGDYFEEN